MYWIHRIGRGTDGSYALHFDALWYVLEKRNCLTIGWHDWLKYPTLVNGVENGDENFIKSEIKKLGYNPLENIGLSNFAVMEKDDITVVLPIPDYSSDIFVVKILSGAKSILKVPANMQADFTTFYTESDGRTVHFDPARGYYYDVSGKMGNKNVDAGFFHEVAILNCVPRAKLSPATKTFCDNVVATNRAVNPLQIQQDIYDTLIPQKFKSQISRPK